MHFETAGSVDLTQGPDDDITLPIPGLEPVTV